MGLLSQYNRGWMKNNKLYYFHINSASVIEQRMDETSSTIFT
jgi:hypothetical protein